MKVTFVINFETLEGILDGDPNECYQANEMFIMLSVISIKFYKHLDIQRKHRFCTLNSLFT